MRVISGEKKGLPLKAVPGKSTRPTTDKVKESIFNMIGPYFEKGILLDLYGGSGGLSIEALSRGMEKAIIIDQDRKAIHTIKENLAKCKYETKVEVFRNEAKKAIKALIKREIQFDLIFLDPPYAIEDIANEIAIIADFELLKKSGVIVCEHSKERALPENIGDLTMTRQEKYGDTCISIFQF
ncbi:16S rRNA (guanine(966)-N(2))-methyltransferase RsmD [Alkalihalobacillus trypoxylicola]|uniref:16S rRNA (Guanine(966)-N(2))-methyltransferase RsmD n=1 Tax=Alkalihalobacillus trypoxylicola TaxID=519424 RepID=A0A161PLF4_9BACI|nr:16S rRNA (guanine(966)-N(2))-methyltransferase RsmD [Alkalihalobacillus trypoxylicola]KYG35196.1 16S rRNA (guanine(966)-N(2))-methyltransferase RsmD [Alkalihalobacillus trypoxylicola]GAF63952.1 methyltransferase [Bacillus sp. TS-2]